MKVVLLALLMGLSPALMAEESSLPARIHCPEPSSIEFQQIPSSIHGYYYAISDGTGFGALSFGLFDTRTIEFLGAEISEINDYWRIYCSYGNGLSTLSLSSNVEAAYAQCHFPDGEQTCEGSLASCEIMCGDEPKAIEDSNTQNIRNSIDSNSRFKVDLPHR